MAARIYSGLMLALSLIYALTLWIGYEWIKPLLLGAKYDGLGLLIAAWMCVVIAQVLREGASITLQAAKEFKRIFQNNVASAVLVVVLMTAMAPWLNAEITVSSLILGEVALGVLLWRALGKLAAADTPQGVA